MRFPVMEQHHHHSLHHHHHHHHEMQSSGSEISPTAQDELDHECDLVTPPNGLVTNNNMQTSLHSNGSSVQGDSKCSLSDIWRMSSPSEIASKLVLMTQAPRICAEMRADGVLPLLVQLLHQHSTDDGGMLLSSEMDSNPNLAPSATECRELTTEMFRSTMSLRRNSAKALRNIIHNTTKSKKELRILGLLEDLRSFVEILYLKCHDLPVDSVDHPCSQLADIFTISCDQECKRTIELLGGVYVISDVIQSDYRLHQESNANEQCYQLRQYSLNILTHMTANNAHVKSLLGSMRPFMSMLVHTLQAAPAINNLLLVQAVANVLHNLSWKTDYSSKQIMRDTQAVTHLAQAAMTIQDVHTMNALLEPLLNLTAHCSPNKADFCKVAGSLEFLLTTLTSNMSSSVCSSSSSNSSTPSTGQSRHQLAIMENSGGILRNVSSFIATQEDLLEMLRSRNVISILLEQLKSASLAIVSNACITLSNLSARSVVEQRKMIDLGAIQMLHNLTNSKHQAIHVGASKALKNLLTCSQMSYYTPFNESTVGMSNSYSAPSSLHMRKMKALKNDLSNCLTENYENLLSDSPNASPKHSTTQTLNRAITTKSYSINMMHNTYNGAPNGLSTPNNGNNSHINVGMNKVTRSSSHDSIGSTHSEPSGTKMLRSSTSQSDHKSAAAAAFMNLASSSSASPLDQRMVNSYSGQTMNSIYATLPANSRICDNKAAVLESASANSANDITSEYDISCCDLGNLNGKSNGGSSSFLDADIGDDPAPTDYSQRFKEQLIDDFTAPRCVSKTENISEDTVKVYQTEGTPLAFSLAPSLSDLRELSDLKNSFHARNEEAKSKLQQQQQANNNPDLIERFAALELSTKSPNDGYKKPHLPPKPGSKYANNTNTSSYNLKNLGSINEETTLEDSNEMTKDNRPNVLIKSMSTHESIDSYSSSSGKDNMDGSKMKVSGEHGVRPPIQFSRSRSINSMMYSNENIVSSSPGPEKYWPNKSPATDRWTPKGRPLGSMVSPPQMNKVVTNTSTESYIPNDCSQVFATEDTPAQFSHATSLSSLSLNDDNPEGDFGCQVVQPARKIGNNHQSNFHQTNDHQMHHHAQQNSEQQQQLHLSSGGGQNVVPLHHHKSKPMMAKPEEVPKEVNQMFDLAARTFPIQSPLGPISKSHLSTGHQSAAAAAAPMVKPTPVAAKRMSKSQHTSQQQLPPPPPLPPVSKPHIVSPSPPLPRRPPKKPLPVPPTNELQRHPQNGLLNIPPSGLSPLVVSGGEDDDYDYLLTKCMQFALPKDGVPPSSGTKITKSSSKSSSTPSSTPNSTRKSPKHSSNKSSSSQPAQSTTTKYQMSPKPAKHAERHPRSPTPQQQHSTSLVPNNNNNKETTEDDDDDDLLLSKCIQSAMPKKEAHKSKKGIGTISHGKSPRVYKKNPSAASAPTTPNNNHPNHHPFNQFLKGHPGHQVHQVHHHQLTPQAPVEDQEKQFYVENTPVMFSQCHSSLSSLIESGDEIEDQMLLEAAIKFDAARYNQTNNNAMTMQPATHPEVSHNNRQTTNSSAPPTAMGGGGSPLPGAHVRPNGKSIGGGRVGNGSSNSSSASRNAVTSGNHQTPNNNVIATANNEPLSNSWHRDTSQASSSLVTSSSSTCSKAEATGSMDDDDERTYTICTQSSRLSSSTLTAGHSSTISHSKSMASSSTLIMSDHSSTAGSVLDLESTNPPSLVDDHQLMFSSTESNMVRSSGPRSIPYTARASSARTKKAHNEYGQLLEHSAPRMASSLEDSPVHSLLENQKPPSIMEHSSLMSQSTASITSEISDIAYDPMPIRKSSSDLVAVVASNCAKEITNLVESCMNGSDGGPSSTSHSVSMSSSSLNNSKHLAVTKSTDDLLVEQRADRTYDMEPTPTSRTLPRSRDRSSTNGTTNGTTTTITTGRSSTNTRTYNKNDQTRTTNTTDKTLEAGKVPVDSDYLVDSDTDISEVLPLDDVKPRSKHSPTKQQQQHVPERTIPAYHNPMDTLESQNKQPPPQPRYQQRAAPRHLVRENFELTDEDFSDGEVVMPIGYSHSLKSRRSRSPHKRPSGVRDETGSIQLDLSAGTHFGSFGGGSDVEQFGGGQSNPYSNHHNFTFHSLGRRGYGSSSTSKQQSKSEKSDFEDKDLMLTAQHKNTVIANHAQFFQSKSNSGQIKTASKYFDRHAAALSSMAHEDVYRTGSDGSSQSAYAGSASGLSNNSSHVPLPTSKRASSQEPSNKANKGSNSSTKGSSSKGSSFLSKLSNSFSSHNLGSHNSTSSGYSSPTGSGGQASSSTKNSFTKINSKIASLWKRSKSTHDKLDQDALTANPGKNMKASDLNRNASGRRSFGRSSDNNSDMNQNIEHQQQQQPSNITRSSTYDRLPVNEQEAVALAQQGQTQTMETNNNQVDYRVDCESPPPKHVDSGNNQKGGGARYGHDSENGNNFTFTTFVKHGANNNNMETSFESSYSTQSSTVDKAQQQRHGNGNNNNNNNNQNKVLRGSLRSKKDNSDNRQPPSNGPGVVTSVEDSSGFSSASSVTSSAQPRKTCLVTTV